jgi:hypothetical protein
MGDVPHVTWTCPTCGRRVDDDRYIVAQEGEDGSVFKPGGLREIQWGRTVRFHRGHYVRQIGDRVYRKASLDEES